MGKMTITAYTDDSFSSEYKSALDLPINPSKVKLNKGIRYAEDKQLGSLNGSNVYVRYQPETFSFECLLDQTAAMEELNDEKKPVRDVVNDLEDASTFTIAKATVPRSSRYSMATSPSSDNLRHSKQNTPCSTSTVSRSVPN